MYLPFILFSNFKNAKQLRWYFKVNVTSVVIIYLGFGHNELVVCYDSMTISSSVCAITVPVLFLSDDITSLCDLIIASQLIGFSSWLVIVWCIYITAIIV